MDDKFVPEATAIGIKDFVCGHDHENNFTINYLGARFTYCVKTGQTVYYHEEENINLNGATIFKISSEKTEVFHYHVKYREYKIS